MNRRMGGNRMGGNNRPSFSQQPFNSGGGGVNPWQGGGGNQGGLIPQLSNQSLALALTSLLQPQQQQHHQQPPSLLSLNTAGGFSNNRDYGNRFSGGISRNRDIRRHEPYNKNRGSFGRKRSPPRNQKGNQKAKTDGKKKNEKKTDETTAEDEDKDDSKRDWKDEKNNESKEGEAEEKEPGNKEGKYSGVPSKYLNCFVCNKQMWDGESMGKHVRGRAHHEMLKALEESIHICVNILRENMRLAEERKAIEYNRQNRQRKFSQRRSEPPMSHCAMCDLKFMGKIVIHRRSEGHQRLKRYLHPTCRMCDKEYPSRIEWIEHCLTPEHLKRAHESSEKKLGGKDGNEIVEGGENEEEEAEVEPENQEELNLEPLLDEALNMEGEEVILEVDDNLENLTNRLPAYKKDRPLATKSLSEFVGWKCDLCHRSFAEQDDADAHLKTKKHFYRFIEVIKDRHDREEKRKKAEKEAALKAEQEAKIKKENGEKEGEEVTEEGNDEAEGDQEMYDPSEATEEATEETSIKEEEKAEEVVEELMDTSVPEEKPKQGQPAKIETPPVTPRVTRKTPAPKSKRGAKK